MGWLAFGVGFDRCGSFANLGLGLRLVFVLVIGPLGVSGGEGSGIIITKKNPFREKNPIRVRHKESN